MNQNDLEEIAKKVDNGKILSDEEIELLCDWIIKEWESLNDNSSPL